MNKDRRILLLLNALIMLIAIIILCVLFPALWNVAGPFIVAIIIAYLLFPLVKRLTATGMKRGMAVTVVTLGTFLVILLFFVILVPQLVSSISQMTKILPDLYTELSDSTSRIDEKLTLLLGQNALSSFNFQDMIDKASEYFSSMLSSFSNTLLASSGQAMNLVIVPIVAVLLLLNTGGVVNKLDYFIPASGRTVTSKMGSDIDRVIGGFIRGQAVMSLCAGLLTAFGAAALGVPYAPVIGIIATVTSFVPYFGPVVGCIIIAILALFSGILPTVVLVIWMGIVQVFCGNVLAPSLMTESVGLSAVGIIFSVFFFGQLMGGVGMLLAVPIAGTLKVLLRYLVKAAANPVSDGEPTRFTPVFPKKPEKPDSADTEDDESAAAEQEKREELPAEEAENNGSAPEEMPSEN